MSKFEKSKVMPRYVAIAALLTLAGLAIIARAGYIMVAQKDYWLAVAASQKQVNNIKIEKPTRGNIFSCDGQLMASSIPIYKIFIDFQPDKRKGMPRDTADVNRLDSIWATDIDSLSIGLAEIFPSRTAAQFKEHLLAGKNKVNKDGSLGSRHWPIWSRRIDYNTYQEVKQLPILSLSAGKGGFHCEEYNTYRNHPFGSLASRTLGGIMEVSDSAYFGLELSYDSLLRGTEGIAHKQKIRNKVMTIIDTPAESGADIVTTIDVTMQDIVERALTEELKKPTVHGELGVAILMEVQTGDIKAIANLMRGEDGEYYEWQNHAISHVCEPGSVFKVASMLVALDDGVIDTSYVIHTGNGILGMHGRPMKDHNWRNGGYGDINAARTLEVSSNIGVSYVIDKFYGANPEKYVEGLYRIGIHDSLPIPLNGYVPPKIRMPQKDKRGKSYVNWSKTALPWMSIGYETQIAPINTVTLYNAIANNGRMMSPRFVKQVMKDGKVIREIPPIVMREQIAKPKTIKTMQTVLRHVVSQGLGRKAGSRSFQVAGKTGTAQVADEHGGYHSGTTRYWLSFCGYFPADNPRYTCIVCIKKTGLPASGGGMSGVAFHHIAEGVMAQNLKVRVEDARDSTSILVPEVKNGDVNAANYVLSQLGITAQGEWDGMERTGLPAWGKAVREKNNIHVTTMKFDDDQMPDVSGMGASDALFLLEEQGLKVRLHGRGLVRKQSIAAGTPLKPGMACNLYLE